MRHQSRHRSVLGTVLLLATAVLLALGAPAGAQTPTSDPYGSTVPPTEPPGDPTCSLVDAEVEVGATVSGSVAGVEAGTEVEIVVGGATLATVVADVDGRGTFSFPQPDLAEPEAVVAVGVTFNVGCGVLNPGAVLGENVDRPGRGSGSGALGSDAPNGGSGSSGSGSGVLARTGSRLVPLVLLGLLALAVGAYLRRRGRGRFAA